jgi:hypothetical protein
MNQLNDSWPILYNGNGQLKIPHFLIPLVKMLLWATGAYPLDRF